MIQSRTGSKTIKHYNTLVLQETFTRKRRGTRHILAVTIGAVIVILIAAVIVLAVLLVRKENDEGRRSGSGDKGGQGQVSMSPPLCFNR